MTRPLWTQDELSSCFDIQGEVGPLGISGVSIDSRNLSAGELFIALTGKVPLPFHTVSDNNRDGHDFIAQAVAAGAGAVMATSGSDVGAGRLQVSDTFDGLWQLAELSRNRMCGQVVAITGSSGKTTARHFLQQLVGTQAITHASVGSFNNHWGVPLSLARMPWDSEVGIFEIGMNHPGEIAPLARLVRPDIAVVLNVVPAHLGYFDKLDSVRQEKLSITHGLKSDGRLVAPDSLNLQGHRADEVVTFGRSADARVQLIEAGPTDGKSKLVDGKRDPGWHVRVKHRGQALQFRLQVGGLHRVETALCALAVIDCLGLDVEQAAADMGDLSPPVGRGNLIETTDDLVVIDDSYNANPVSMAEGLKQLTSLPGNRHIAILGEMLELGDESEMMHAALLPQLESLDGVVLVGTGFANISAALGEKLIQYIPDATDLDAAAIAALLQSGDRVMVKGANRVFWIQGFVPRLLEAWRIK